MVKISFHNYVLVQITDYGWEYLQRSYSDNFIEKYIRANAFLIDGEVWYKIRAVSVFDWFGSAVWNEPPWPLKNEILLTD